MKNIISLLLVVLFILGSSFIVAKPLVDNGVTSINGTEESPESISWADMKSVLGNSSDNDKKYFVYIYTDWCSFCKKMTTTTFEDKEVIKLLNDKFIAVKFNAESKETLNYKGTDFKFVSSGGIRGYHEFAAALTNNQLSYPTIVFLDENFNMIQPLPGYKSAQDLSIILRFLGDKIYETRSFEEYYKEQTTE